ncbi:MAG: DNA double-strand break repair nuclease NurA [Candidatus Jordarchaeales archaeon]
MYEYDELVERLRKMEFDKTEPELLTSLLNKAMDKGEYEKERLKRISKKSLKLFKFLADERCFCRIDCESDTLEYLKRTPIGGVDGSFQVVGGIGGKWYVFLGFSQVIAKACFTTNPIIRVDGDIQDIEAVDEGDARRQAELLMMHGEIEGFRKIANELDSKKEPCILIDGPIIDPPTLIEEKYVDRRVSALKYCYERKIDVVGFVKRVSSNGYVNFLKNKFQEKLGEANFNVFVNDSDFLSTTMFEAVKEMKSPVYTYPVSYDESCYNNVYEYYKRKGGLTLYYSYYKPSLRARIFRIEYVSFRELNKDELCKKFEKIMNMIRLWTLPGMDEPLPIMLAHNKCNVRRGAAETLYHEIMTRALSEGVHPLWLSEEI